MAVLVNRSTLLMELDPKEDYSRNYSYMYIYILVKPHQNMANMN